MANFAASFFFNTRQRKTSIKNSWQLLVQAPGGDWLVEREVRLKVRRHFGDGRGWRVPGVLRVPRLQRLLGADVHGDRDHRQDADVPGEQTAVMLTFRKKKKSVFKQWTDWQQVLAPQIFSWPECGSLEGCGLILLLRLKMTKKLRKNYTQNWSCKQRWWGDTPSPQHLSTPHNDNWALPAAFNRSLISEIAFTTVKEQDSCFWLCRWCRWSDQGHWKINAHLRITCTRGFWSDFSKNFVLAMRIFKVVLMSESVVVPLGKTLRSHCLLWMWVNVWWWSAAV